MKSGEFGVRSCGIAFGDELKMCLSVYLSKRRTYLRYIVGRGLAPAIGEAAMGNGGGGKPPPYSGIS